MAHYAATVTSPGSAAEVFEYLADFSSTAEWDPGVSEARRLNADPLRAGARFHVVADFLGRRVPLEYRTVEIDPPRRVVLRAETRTVVSEDTITVRALPGSGSQVTYDARLGLRGALRFADPVARPPVPAGRRSGEGGSGRNPGASLRRRAGLGPRGPRESRDRRRRRVRPGRRPPSPRRRS